MSEFDLSKVPDDEIFREAMKRIKEHPLKAFHFDYPIAEIADITVQFDERAVEGVFIVQK